MTIVKKKVKRETIGTVFEKGKHRPVIVSIEPPNIISFRLKGMKTSYSLTTQALYMMALKAHLSSEQREKTRKKRK